uniref:Ubiquitin-conjugating enzyme E2 H n=2 Tax=Hirondellea gigas TaxID=1518452 RepID=A0A6A7G7U9_9CRUS
MSSPSKRRDADVLKLMMTDHKVSLAKEDSVADFFVLFEGPSSSPYEGGKWRVHVVLPIQYPFKSPSIGFCNRIYHPNIDEASGTVCLDVINQTWSPMYDLVNIFDIFLPQLLKYPNSADPLNSSAASLYSSDQESYLRKVREYVLTFASTDSDESDDWKSISSHPSSTDDSEDDHSSSDDAFSDFDDDGEVMEQMADSMEI